MSATALKSTNRRFSSLNYQNFEFFCLVPWSPTHTGLICEKKTRSQISQAWAPLQVDGNEREGHSNSGSVWHCGDRGLF